MANDDHIKLLLEGIDPWNEWRSEHIFEGNGLFRPDFRDADIWSIFRDADKLESHANYPELGKFFIPLAWADLSYADFTNANLGYSILIGTDFYDATLTGTILAGSEPWMAHLGPRRDYVLRAPTPYQISETLVKSVQDLLTEIQGIQELHAKDDAEITLYFRGEFEWGWPLKPSVMRDEKVLHESEMLVDLVARRPEEFNELHTALARWVLAAHHGLPTRFLDITSNPLVALFHACDDTDQLEVMKKTDGRLNVFAISRTSVKSFDSDTISIIANFARLKPHQQHTILGLVEGVLPDDAFKFRTTEHWHGAMRILYQNIRQEKPYFDQIIDPRDFYRVFVVEPQRSWERIRAQSGAFLTSAFHEQFDDQESFEYIPEPQSYAHHILRISGDDKEDIIGHLKSLGISRETLFPGLDSSAKAVKDSYENR